MKIVGPFFRSIDASRLDSRRDRSELHDAFFFPLID
jgi:hypothetical protein